ncbi:hypothetical protein LCGC14_1147490 [marine sediment metagenome]|uniref:Uncharacterized protein n=1 Tax=marine sediment metagenome TaxID=412755 RepID=A0A0F9Q246_9ZZZZ|nr:hypothetical protein [Phycisphaerae bacterium]HDZ44730.1 hypothetical protein [Phycisphaerae bacterium]
MVINNAISLGSGRPSGWVGQFEVGDSVSFGPIPMDALTLYSLGYDIQPRSALSPWVRLGYAGFGLADRCTCSWAVYDPATGYSAADQQVLSGAGPWVYTVDTTDWPAGMGMQRITFAWEWDGPGYGWIVDRYILLGSGGGGGSDLIVSLFSYERPEMNHVVYQTLNGDLIAKQGPS